MVVRLLPRMEVVMALLTCLAASLVLAGAEAPPPRAAAVPEPSGELRWVVGVVTVLTPETLTVRLRDETKTLTLGLDQATMFVPVGRAPADAAARPAAGAVVEIHYADRDDVRTAALVFETATAAAVELSKKPGRSYRGVARQIRRGTLTMQVATRSRGVQIDRKTRLLDIGGATLATGSRPIADLVSAGDELLVKYDGDVDIMPIGDMMLYLTSKSALEVRRLRDAGTEGTDDRGRPVAGRLSEKIRVPIKGVEQGMFVRGRDPAKPVLLFVHGGTGMPEYFLDTREALLAGILRVPGRARNRAATKPCALVAPDGEVQCCHRDGGPRLEGAARVGRRARGRRSNAGAAGV